MVRTLSNIALMEKLEAATPEALVSELYAGNNAAKTIKTGPAPMDRARSASPPAPRASHGIATTGRRPRPTSTAPDRSAHFVLPLRRTPAAALASEGLQKLHMLRTRIPVRAAGVTVGSFRHLQDRTAAIVPGDDGTVAGGAAPLTPASESPSLYPPPSSFRAHCPRAKAQSACFRGSVAPGPGGAGKHSGNFDPATGVLFLNLRRSPGP